MKKTLDASEVRILRAELLDAHRELAQLRVQTDQLIASNRELSNLLTHNAHQTAELMKSVVALRRMVESEDSASALRSIEEILVNVIGTEDFAIMAVENQETLRPVAGMGPAVRRARETPQTLQEIQDAGKRVVPMYIGNRLVAVITIDELLPHREELNHSDDQVLSLVSRFGASAVMTAEHRKSWTTLTVPESA